MTEPALKLKLNPIIRNRKASMTPIFMTPMKAAFHLTYSAIRQSLALGDAGLEFWRYGVDFSQRAVLMADVLRRRGNQYFEYNEAGLPPITPFPLEVILDGRSLDRPVNRTLVRIKDRRTADDGRNKPFSEQEKRPIIFQDPDAGRGLISASRNTSEIGLAIDTGHPSFLILVQPETVPGQTMDDLTAATRIFTEKVREICPHEKPPAYVGNCQAGWQMALSAAQSPGIDGPVVPVGAPLSYWSRGPENHSLRFSGGLGLGTWAALFLGDIGDGVIDALSPLTFEVFDIDRHPILDSLKWLQEVDNERKIGVFLNQQKWIYGFHEIGAEQFHWIIRELFVGNKLERGLVTLDGRPVDMKRIRSAIVFTSFGDTITPVSQGIGWIPRVWSSVEEMKAAGVKLALIHHDQAGHLAIFVSAKVADREHRGIISVLGDDFDSLPPGLYKMEITEAGDHPTAYTSSFREMDLDEIREMLDDTDRPLFHRAAAVSEAVEQLYRKTARPWVRLISTPVSAELFRLLHPMRFRASFWADQSHPLASVIETAAAIIRDNRQPVPADNIGFRTERAFRELLAVGLNLFRAVRDSSYEWAFNTLYSDANPVMRVFLPRRLFEDDGVDPAEVARRRFPALYREMSGLMDREPVSVFQEIASYPAETLAKSFVQAERPWRSWIPETLSAGGLKFPWPTDILDPKTAPFLDWQALFSMDVLSRHNEWRDAASTFPWQRFFKEQKGIWTDWPWGYQAALDRLTAAGSLS